MHWGSRVKGGTSQMDSSRTKDLPRRNERAAHNVHKCECVCVCAWDENILSAPKWLPLLQVSLQCPHYMLYALHMIIRHVSNTWGQVLLMLQTHLVWLHYEYIACLLNADSPIYSFCTGGSKYITGLPCNPVHNSHSHWNSILSRFPCKTDLAVGSGYGTW